MTSPKKSINTPGATPVDEEAAEIQQMIARRAKLRAEEQREAVELFEQLSEPFPPEMERTLVKGGTRLTYLPVSEIITRLNRIFGPTGWSSEIIKCERDTLDSDFIVAHVRLTARYGEFGYTTKDGFGGQKIKRTKQGEIVDLGDEFKGAVSDALKKAAQQLGLGLYLARDPDAIEIDEAMHAPEPAPVSTPVTALYEKFMTHRNVLTDVQLKELRSYWTNYSGGRPVPKPHEFTAEELEVLIVECTRLAFDGEYTVPKDDVDSDE